MHRSSRIHRRGALLMTDISSLWRPIINNISTANGAIKIYTASERALATYVTHLLCGVITFYRPCRGLIFISPYTSQRILGGRGQDEIKNERRRRRRIKETVYFPFDAFRIQGAPLYCPQPFPVTTLRVTVS